MRLLFVRHANLISGALRMTMWSDFSHGALLFSDGTVIEAAAFHGVRTNSAAVLCQEASVYAFGDVSCDERRVRAFAEKQLGKPYDWKGALGIATHRDWQEDDFWFCFELMAAALADAGLVLVNKKIGRVSGPDLYESVLVRMSERFHNRRSLWRG